MKKIAGTKHFDNIMILIDTDDKLSDDITLKNFVICVAKDDDKFYPQLFLEKILLEAKKLVASRHSSNFYYLRLNHEISLVLITKLFCNYSKLRQFGIICFVSFWYFLKSKHRDNLFCELLILFKLKVLGQFPLIFFKLKVSEQLEFKNCRY